MASSESPRRDWLLSVRLPTIELRDALINDVADSVIAETTPPVVAVRMIGVEERAESPMLTMHIRTRTAISGHEAEAVAIETLQRHASRLDLSAVMVDASGPPSPDEPSMR